MDELVHKYRKGIPRTELTSAFKVYYETHDLQIREQIIYRFMPIVKGIILSFNIPLIEEDDLVQVAYLELISSIEMDYKNYFCFVFFYKMD